jgi:hypothetical protein
MVLRKSLLGDNIYQGAKKGTKGQQKQYGLS